MLSPNLPPIPHLKLNRMQEPLHLGDSMKITGLHENGFLAQLNGSVEVLLVPGSNTDCTSYLHQSHHGYDSPPHHHSYKSSKKSSTHHRSQSQPSPSRSPSMSPSIHSEMLVDNLCLSPRAFSLPLTTSLSITTTLNPRNRTKSLANADSIRSRPSGSSSSSSCIQSNPSSPRTSPSITPARMSPPIPSSFHSPPRQIRNGVKSVQRSYSYNYYPVQGWVLWRKSIGQWERVWLASKKSPTRICFYTSENEDSEETESIRVECIKSIWAPEEDENKKKTSPSVHFRLFTEKKTIYLIVQTMEKMKYWITGLKKLNPEIELDVFGSEPASPISPRPMARYLLSDPHNTLNGSLSFNGDSEGTDEEELDEWD